MITDALAKRGIEVPGGDVMSLFGMAGPGSSGSEAVAPGNGTEAAAPVTESETTALLEQTVAAETAAPAAVPAAPAAHRRRKRRRH